MAAKPLPPIEYLRECFSYCPETGILTWKVRPREHFNSDPSWRGSNTKFAGKPAGSLQDRGDGQDFYICIEINGLGYMAHRIIWALVHGVDPDGTIDHWDGASTNNRLGNLRLCTQAHNTRNRKNQRPGRLKGTSFRPRLQKWSASIGHNGMTTYLGVFHTEEEAHAAYCRAAAELHGEFACTDR